MIFSRANFRRISTLKQIMEAKIAESRQRLTKLKKDHGNVPIDQVTIDQVVRGMRGMKALLTETSRLDPFKGITFRGLSIPECQQRLHGKYREPMPESMYWLLLTGEVPTFDQVEELRGELAKRSQIPAHTLDLLNSLPKHMHPMTQLSMGVLSLGAESEFMKAYDAGVKKSEYWISTLEDSLSLVAKLPGMAAIIYNNVYKDGKTCDPSIKYDLSENFGRMLGFSDNNFFELMRLYLTIHCDHEGGNVSSHTTHLVGSALSDVYKAYSAGLNGLAGPLHGLANQECLKWLLELWKVVGDNAEEDSIAVYVKETLKNGKVVPGYGHAVLRVTDPRFLVQMEFAKKSIDDCPLCKIVALCYKVIPRVLKEHGKAQNPYPNVDAHSGALLYYYGLREFEFYTVLFGVSRALGCTASTIWDRALMLPIERPASMTMEGLEEFAAKE
ncbi:unnamed protein product [Blepharisma stoltei]|uniref:Citrate synthase n=1 Tax=Blepharisma stoltei TaxID=1481888 RepID=A0AAU9JF67_9CILI|nr:unnamed protein product [Blepharisma stoltei]